MKTILYATDFSDNATRALEYAAEICRKTGAELVAFHVYHGSTTISDSVVSSKINKGGNTENFFKDHLREYCEKHLGDGIHDLSVRYKVVESDTPLPNIVNMIYIVGADLIVMGSKVKSRLEELVTDNTSYSVIKEAACPVLTIPEGADLTTIRNFVYATDFEETDVDCINTFVSIASVFDATMNVVHISTNTGVQEKTKVQWFRELLLEQVAYPRLSFELFRADNIYDRLIHYVRENNVGVIGMMERESDSLFKQWFHRDLVKRMEYHGNVPLLSFNEIYLDKMAKARKVQASSVG